MPEEVFTSVIPKSCHERFFAATTKATQALVGQGFRGCGASELHAPYVIRRLYPATHAVIYTLAGAGWLETAGKRFVVEAGSVMTLPAAIDHQYGTEKFWQTIWFHLAPAPHWDCLIPGEAVVFAAAYAERLRAIGDEFLHEIEGGDRSDSAEILNELTTLFRLFLRRELASLASHNQHTHHRDHLENLWKRVMQEPARKWTIGSLAREAGLSRSHLHFLMKRLYGVSAMEKVTRLRIEWAIQRLYDPSEKIAAIADEVGYDTPYSFSRAFKRIVGISPLQYRAANAIGGGEGAFSRQ